MVTTNYKTTFRECSRLLCYTVGVDQFNATGFERSRGSANAHFVQFSSRPTKVGSHICVKVNSKLSENAQCQRPYCEFSLQRQVVRERPPTSTWPPGEGPRAAPFFRFLISEILGGLRSILETNPPIFLIFCIRPDMTDLRTNPYWRFSEFLLNVDFFVFFWFKNDVFSKNWQFLAPKSNFFHTTRLASACMQKVRQLARRISTRTLVYDKLTWTYDILKVCKKRAKSFISKHNLITR